MSMYKVGYVPKTIEEYKDNLFWLIMDWANLKEIDGVEYIEFQWLMEALKEAKGVKHSGLIEKAEKENKK